MIVTNQKKGRTTEALGSFQPATERSVETNMETRRSSEFGAPVSIKQDLVVHCQKNFLVAANIMRNPPASFVEG